ncbi:MAG TPA: twin-arginine translocation signal domain-containing protein, partial [Tepidisphaeraceae bacterium]|nr:twin-arginine translocation signal domain-containing protein [Tepidisphaeraceae bacterium]
MNRREFLKHSGVTVGAAALTWGCGQDDPAGTRSSQPSGPKEVRVVCDPGDPIASTPPARWAAEQLCKTLAARGITARTCEKLEDVPPTAMCVVAGGSATQACRDLLSQHGANAPSSAEALGLASGSLYGRAVTLACGYDGRGLVYALTELADAAAHASDPVAALAIPSPVVEKPANHVRSIMRLFSSDIEDKPWFNDRGFWERYLSMLVSNRFNRFNLALGLGYDFPNHIRDAYFYFAYPFLLSVPGYEVRAPQLPDTERDANLAMLKFISDQCAVRGLNFQLGIWTHAYEWPDSPGVNYTVEGLNAEKHAAYCRDAIRILLRECPNITGVTFRIHGESGVAEGSYDFWKTLFDGVATCGRPVPIDMHAKGMDQPMIDLALATGLPITISPKYWAEHMGLPYHQAWIRPTELPREQRGGQGFFSRSSGSRSFLRYGYGDLMREDRKYGIVFRMWPGTQRFLLWGDPEMAAGYGRASSFCGALGLDLFEPLSFKGRKGSGMKGGRNAYADRSLNPADDWEKFRYTYKLWGRLTYNPDCDAEVWRRDWHSEHSDGSEIE